jgi:hypothetical protein
MTWYRIEFQGQTYIENLTGADEKILSGLGIHGYATEAEAQAHPQTMNVLQGAAGGANVLAGTTAAPGVAQPGEIAAGAGGVASAAPDVGSVLKGLTSRELWVRVAEGVLGLALLLVAVAELGKGTGAGKLAKAVPFI